MSREEPQLLHHAVPWWHMCLRRNTLYDSRCWHSVDYLSVEYIFDQRGESRVVFIPKVPVRKPSFNVDDDDDDDENTPKYAVYRLYMEPQTAGGRSKLEGSVRFERILPDVTRRKPKQKNALVPDFTPVALDSVAEFYLDLREPSEDSGSCPLTITRISFTALLPVWVLI